MLEYLLNISYVYLHAFTVKSPFETFSLMPHMRHDSTCNNKTDIMHEQTYLQDTIFSGKVNII